MAKAARKEKKPREPDPVFPRSGTPWSDDDDSLLDTLIEGSDAQWNENSR